MDLYLSQFLFNCCKLCHQRFYFCFQIGNGFLGFLHKLFQLALLLLLYYKLLCRCYQRLIILTLYSHLRGQLGFNLLHGLNGNLLLLDTLKGLFQFHNFFFSFLLLKSQNAEMLLVLTFLLPLDNSFLLSLLYH